jgi:hypothetical protein
MRGEWRKLFRYQSIGWPIPSQIRFTIIVVTTGGKPRIRDDLFCRCQPHRHATSRSQRDGITKGASTTGPLPKDSIWSVNLTRVLDGEIVKCAVAVFTTKKRVVCGRCNEFLRSKAIEMLFADSISERIDEARNIRLRFLSQRGDYLFRRQRHGERRGQPITEDVMFKWRLLVEEGRKAGIPSRSPI